MWPGGQHRTCNPAVEDCKLEKGPTDKAKEPDPGGSDQQNLGFKKLKTEKLKTVEGNIGYIYIYIGSQARTNQNGRKTAL